MMFRNILAVAAIATLPAAATFAQTASPVIDVAKSAGCACCNGWIARMEEAGFTLEPRNISSDDLYDLKMTTGIPMDLWACHTASVAGYTVEGHVPGADIRRLLQDRPVAVGIAVGGMPVGSPGMDNEGAPGMNFGSQTDAYEVMLIRLDRSTEVYASYPGS